MNKLPLISSPLSEAWPSWLLLGLLLCIVMAEVLQPETIKMSFRTTFSRMERMFGDSAVNFLGAVALNIYRLGIISLTLYLVCYKGGEFSMLTYGLILLAIIAFVACKSFFAWILSYTAGLFCVDILIKLVQHFYQGLSSLGYIALYTLTLEIIPLAVLVLGVRQIA